MDEKNIQNTKKNIRNTIGIKKASSKALLQKRKQTQTFTT